MSLAIRFPGRLATLAGALACGCLAVWSFALGFADLAMARPRAALAAWEQGEPVGDYRSRRRLSTRIGRAIAVHPFDAGQRMELGRFFVWHAARHPEGSLRARLYRQLAADRFREAVTARPTWGFAWLSLAEQWLHLGVDPARVRDAMQRGARLAPREPVAQLKHLWLGLGQWDTLDAAERGALERALAWLMGFREYFRDAVGIALHHGRADLVTGALHAPWQREGYARIAQARGG